MGDYLKISWDCGYLRIAQALPVELRASPAASGNHSIGRLPSVRHAGTVVRLAFCLWRPLATVGVGWEPEALLSEAGMHLVKKIS